MLISLCGSINSFIEGYQEILSKSLLMVQNYDIEHEVSQFKNIYRRVFHYFHLLVYLFTIATITFLKIKIDVPFRKY